MAPLSVLGLINIIVTYTQYQWVKKMAFFVLINARANGNSFRVKKSHISIRFVFFINTLYASGKAEQCNVLDRPCLHSITVPGEKSLLYIWILYMMSLSCMQSKVGGRTTMCLEMWRIYNIT